MQREINLAELLTMSGGLRLKRGRVLEFGAAGQMWIENEENQCATLCEFLRMTAAPPPQFAVGERILYLCDEQSDRGYVLGVIGTAFVREVPRDLKIEALESIEVRCGASSLVMSKEGRLTLRGTEVTSRASRINKIKGAAVKIN